MLRLLPKSKVGGIPGPAAYHKKYTQRRRLRRNSLPDEDFRVKRLYQPKKSRFYSTLIFKLHTSNSIFKLHSSNSIFNTALFKFYLQASISAPYFRQIVQFQIVKNLLKSSKLNRRILAHFEKMGLAR